MIFVFRRFGWLVARDRAALLPVSPVECPLETSKRGCSPLRPEEPTREPNGGMLPPPQNDQGLRLLGRRCSYFAGPVGENVNKERVSSCTGRG